MSFDTEANHSQCLHEKNDLVVFSHLRWDFVFQRPQHLMTRFSKTRRVFFFEEPLFRDQEGSFVTIERGDGRFYRVLPVVSSGVAAEKVVSVLRSLLDDFLKDEQIEDFSSWYYTPMALEFSRHLEPRTVIYDCMDELSLFKGAPPALIENEKELMRRADLVFTGGRSLFEAKKGRHHNIHPFPSSIDSRHFVQARRPQSDPSDQSEIPHPRLGFFGVIDERMDLELIEKIASLKPDWQFVMIGPVVKIDPGTLPRARNIHYLGKKDYRDLPFYLSGWDVAMMPFARNEATRFISPTKTPEYLCAGCPVVSTSIRDVVSPYAEKGLVHIADRAEDFVEAAEKALKQRHEEDWIRRVDSFLASMSWDQTWRRMAAMESRAARKKILEAARNDGKTAFPWLEPNFGEA
ncbi:MAG TPA: glycosyltransferase family 1 protein, partial [Pseudobdellovibrionaceae bacterium]|nr:glycosyltransferase family 1 protein [Pseudobdellovibrionaceae bacterium]